MIRGSAWPRVAGGAWVWSILYSVVAAAMMSPGLLVGPSLDAAVFEAVGWRLSLGDALYAEIWDHKPPGMFVPALVSHLLADGTGAWIVTWLLSVGAIALTATAIERTLRANGLGASAVTAAMLSVLGLGSYVLALGGGMGETFAAALAACAAWAVSRPDRGWVRWFLAGLLAAAAVMISVQLAPVIAYLAVLGFTAGGGARAIGTRAMSVAAGFVVVATVSMIAIVTSGSPRAAWDAIVAYNAAYRQEAAVGFGSVVPYAFLVLLPLIVPAGMAVLSLRYPSAMRRMALAATAWIMLGLLAVLIQGRFYGHYALAFVVPLGLLAGIGLDRMLGRPLRRGRTSAVLAPIALAVVVSLAVGSVGGRMEQARYAAANARVEAVALVVAEHSDPGSSILVWGNQPRLYELSGRAPAFRYIYLYPLLTEGYVSDELVAGLARQMRADPPDVVVDAGSDRPGEPGLPPLLQPRPVATDGRDTDLLNPLRAVVRVDYVARSTVAGWTVYVRNTAEPDS